MVLYCGHAAEMSVFGMVNLIKPKRRTNNGGKIISVQSAQPQQTRVLKTQFFF